MMPVCNLLHLYKHSDLKCSENATVCKFPSVAVFFSALMYMHVCIFHLSTETT